MDAQQNELRKMHELLKLQNAYARAEAANDYTAMGRIAREILELQNGPQPKPGDNDWRSY